MVPVDGAPLHNAKVTVANSIIRELQAEARGRATHDVGEVVLMPQLINAHTHLEFSNLRQPVGHSGISITEWIPKVIEARLRHSESVDDPIRTGAGESANFGTIALGDMATAHPNSNQYDPIPLATCFLERIGNRPDRIEAVMRETQDFLDFMRQSPDDVSQVVTPGLSPHAPYSVHPELFRQLLDLAKRESLPVAMHLAESREELEWLRTGKGPFRDLLESLGALPPEIGMRDWNTPGDYLRQLAQLEHVLIVHGNYLTDEELEFVGDHRDRFHLIYCPRTHHFFRHAPYPLAAALNRRINVAIGTDSRASNPDLNVWRELKMIQFHHPQIDPLTILQMGTVNSAQALGLASECGSLAVGTRAAFLKVPIDGDAVTDPVEFLFKSEREPTVLITVGRWSPP